MIILVYIGIVRYTVIWARRERTNRKIGYTRVGLLQLSNTYEKEIKEYIYRERNDLKQSCRKLILLVLVGPNIL